MIVIGLDHGNTKVKGKSEDREWIRPSAFARPQDLGEEGIAGDRKFKLKEFVSNKFEDEVYVWGEDVEEASRLIPTYTNENRYSQKAYRMLTEFSLAELLPKGKKTFDNVLVVTGCPSTEKGTKLETELEQVFAGGHVVKVDGQTKMMDVAQVIILPQPLGTVLSLYLDDEGYVADESYEEDYVGVIDIGGGTTDLDGIKGLKRQKEDTETISEGMFDVYKRISVFINQEKPEAKATPQSVEQQILNGSDTYVISKRSSVDMKQVKEEAFRDFAQYLIAQINTSWKNRAKFDKLLLTGGGAAPLATFFKEWEKDIIVVPDGQKANATGFYRYGKFKSRG